MDLQPTVFFDLSDFEHAALFDGINLVWEALGQRLKDCVASHARADVRGVVMEGAWIDPENAIGDAVDSAAPQAEARQAQIHRVRGAEGHRVFADPDRLQQVMLNLVSNSIKYNAAPAPEIWIETRLHDGRFEIEVSDNGDGVPDNQDECVDVPEDLNGVEDEDGCPEGPEGEPAPAPAP